MARYAYEPFPYEMPPELRGGAMGDAPVAIIGAGPIGLSLAIDLALQGVKSIVLDDNDVVSIGSRAICWAKRTLEIFDRLGVGERMLEKGVTWKVGRLFHGDREVYSFDLLPENGHKYPAFINLQQYYVEQYLAERCRDFPDLIELRFKNEVFGHRDYGDRVVVRVSTSDGPYELQCRYLVACDGSRSPTRQRMGLTFEGHSFEEQFLIADIEMDESPFGSDAAERWFWFEPPFHDGQSSLLHKQPDNIYRIDLQLGPDADVERELSNETVVPRLKRILGDKQFTVDWLSIYKFTCARLERFVHGRVIFCGDSAHVVSPFGARGGNGGIHDVDNLGWKLAAVVKGTADEALLASYDRERGYGSDENILHSSRATSFMTPKSDLERLFRDEVLGLATDHSFARRLINSGRLSVPCSLEASDLQTPSEFALVRPGMPVVDAPLETKNGPRWLVELIGNDFVAVSFGNGDDPELRGVPHIRVHPKGSRLDHTGFVDVTGMALERYGEGLTYLFRPDAHVAAAFRHPGSKAILKARQRAVGQKTLQAAV
ncbi:FAD-dependent oxidoreductase [Oricola cellulosilytica]|uniref:FAD-dependent oxidoreductase n=1 Tax=Oricola cellulosilytica TaxID=1429082 RepID=A0A4R0PGX0_9HYPH|nr:FAD-dependent oxidoreductase [Oricola cellulosilytica]TCD14864.1 FAD-dependent oxidoreductase [Oricola cellulosilytica]